MVERHSRGPEAADVVVVGAGPNGLAAAITVARAGRSVVVLEATSEPGGATRSAPLLGPGFVNDVGSSTHPLSVASPFMATIPWSEHGLEWVRSPAAVAHPLDDDRAAVAWNDLERTADDLASGGAGGGGGRDGDVWRSMIGAASKRFDQLVELTMAPPLKGALRHPLTAARFGPVIAAPASLLARRFDGPRARALLAGHAAHAVAPLNKPFTGGFGLLLGASAHAVGWPFPRGGAGEIARVLTEVLEGLGGSIVTDHPVRSLADLPPHGAAVFAVTAGQLASIVDTSPDGGTGDGRSAGGSGSARTVRRLRRFRYGPGACKVDLALSEPIPWADPAVAEAATVHLGGTFDEVAEAEATVAAGNIARRPYVLLTQHSRFDPSRAPEGRHTVWAYCHVPNGAKTDASATIENQIERFAPGFRETILERRVSLPADLERGNANLVGGDVGGGAYTGLQAVFRPGIGVNPYVTGVPGVFIASASASPGGGVHGMAGHLGAVEALRFLK